MSTDIDMSSYTGEIEQAAAVQTESNSYLAMQQEEDYPVHTDLLEPPQEQIPEAQQEVATESDQVVPVQTPESNPQAENFRALSQEVERIKAGRDADRKDYEMQLQILKANLNQPPQAQQQAAPRVQKMFDGMQDDDVPNVAELRKEWSERENSYQERLEELQVAQRFPDYQEVIQKHLVPLIQQKPHLANVIQASSNKALVAYELGMMAKAATPLTAVESALAQATPPQPRSDTPVSAAVRGVETAQRIVDNSRKPGTLSSAGGSGTLSKADFYASMSEKDFAALAAKHMDEI